MRAILLIERWPGDEAADKIVMGRNATDASLLLGDVQKGSCSVEPIIPIWTVLSGHVAALRSIRIARGCSIT